MMSCKQLAASIQAIWDQVDREERDATPEERHYINNLLGQLKQQKSIEMRIDEIGRGWFPEITVPGDPTTAIAGDAGSVFVQSEGFKAISGGARPERWSTGAVELPSLGYKATAGTLSEADQGAGFVVTPQVIPGQVQKLFQPLGVADLLAGGVATTSSVRYLVEGTATSGAAAVAEAASKPGSDLALSTTDEPVKKIATVLTVTDELLDDVPAVQSYINGRLSLFVQMELDRQLLRGGGSNELVGLTGRSGVNTYAKLAADDNAVCLARTLANTKGSSYLEPDAIIMHPTNWLTTRLLRDGTGGTAGQFYGGRPPAYNTPAPAETLP
jgi:HK97 family phage major capsid protein